VRIVLDTNIAVSALLWRGTPYRLFEIIRPTDDVQLVGSEALLAELAELADVLARPSVSKRLAIVGRTALLGLP
jgi:predicted nucleic acid-binding protein